MTHSLRKELDEYLIRGETLPEYLYRGDMLNNNHYLHMTSYHSIWDPVCCYTSRECHTDSHI